MVAECVSHAHTRVVFTNPSGALRSTHHSPTNPQADPREEDKWASSTGARSHSTDAQTPTPHGETRNANRDSTSTHPSRSASEDASQPEQQTLQVTEITCADDILESCRSPLQSWFVLLLYFTTFRIAFARERTKTHPNFTPKRNITLHDRMIGVSNPSSAVPT
jgi:hypothetical protein